VKVLAAVTESVVVSVDIESERIGVVGDPGNVVSERIAAFEG
jgi:hypothetical protein